MTLFRTGLAACAASALLLAGCSTQPAGGGSTDATGSGTIQAGSGGTASVLDATKTSAALTQLGSSAGKDLKPARLGTGLVPPTNKWFSGLVFGDTAQPVFPYPLSFGLDAQGFGFGLPEITTTQKTIMGGYRPTVKVGVPGATSWQVTGYDELSVTLTAQGASGVVTLAEGSPFVTFASEKGATVSTNVSFAKQGNTWVAQDATGTYGLVADKADVSATSITVQPGGHVTWFAVPDGGSADAMAKLADPVKGTSASYRTGDKVTTTLHYGTVGGGQTAFGVLPHQAAGLQGASCDLGTYKTILGAMKVCSGNDLTFTTDAFSAVAGLDLARLSAADKDELKKQITADVAAAKPYPADTYFGGKALARDAQLYLIAKQIGAPEAAALKTKVTDQLVKWTSPTGCANASEFCFTYDSTNKGIVGKTPSFGSDEFNDHHFHYGYFLYAAGVLAGDDPSLVDKIGPVMNLLAADIASSTPSASFPVRRNFDSYVGHSWASGTSPFADGNNQESSSEAVNAWAGLTLWARASKNDALATEGTWMQSLEATSARDYYLAFDKSDPVYSGYGHEISPLIFGGKRDYATWFSPEPAAALAIQVLPVTPSSGYLKTDTARIAANLKEGVGTKGFQQTYGDSLILYSALQGEQQRQDALTAARSLPASFVDDGNTKTFMLAYLMSLKS